MHENFHIYRIDQTFLFFFCGIKTTTDNSRELLHRSNQTQTFIIRTPLINLNTSLGLIVRDYYLIDFLLHNNKLRKSF